MRKLLSTVAVALVIVAGATAPVAAVCAPHAPRGSFDRADVVFVGVAQPGHSAGGRLTSPVTFDVLEYQKGKGPSSVRVTAGVESTDGKSISVSSVGIVPAAGERWQIYGTFSGDVLQTSSCAGSRQLGRNQNGYAASPAASGTAAIAADSAALPDTGMPLHLLSLGAACVVLGAVLLRRFQPA